MKRKRLGEILEDRGELTAENLKKLFEEQKGKAIRLGELILESGLVDKSALISALEEVSRVPYLDCSTIKCERTALETIPASVAKNLAVLPIKTENMMLIVAMAEPQNLAIIDELAFTSGRVISPRLAFRTEILAAISRNYGNAKDHLLAGARKGDSQGDGGEAPAEMEFFSTSSRQANRDAIEEVQAELHQNRTPAVRLVTEIIQTAMLKRASDIHIEPQATATIVRIRVDGVLRELESVSRALQNSLISRIKILSDMDIGERRAPQDGRFLVTVGERKIDMRVSTLPTQYGEKIVMRLAGILGSLAQLCGSGHAQGDCRQFDSIAVFTPGNGAGNRTDRLWKKFHTLFGLEYIAQARGKYRHG